MKSTRSIAAMIMLSPKRISAFTLEWITSSAIISKFFACIRNNHQRTFEMTEESMQEEFEQWYVENAFNYEANPIGSRECGLQREGYYAAWHARDAEVQALKDELAKYKNAEPVAWMYPSDITDFQDGEKFATAFSIQVGKYNETTVPLFTHPDKETK